MSRVQKVSGFIVGALAGLLASSLLLPGADIPVPLGSLSWEYRTHSVGNLLFRSSVSPNSVYLASVPFVALGLVAICRSLTAARIGSFLVTAYVFLPNIPIPKFWPGALLLFLFEVDFSALFMPVPTVYRFGLYLFLGLFVLVGIAALLRGILLLRVSGPRIVPLS